MTNDLAPQSTCEAVMRKTPEITLLSIGLGFALFVALAVGIRFGWSMGMDYWRANAVQAVQPAKTGP